MMTRRIKYLLVAMSALLFPLCLQAQEAQEDNTFGGWEFLEVYHDFGKSPVFASIYFEHDNFQYKRLDNWYIRTTAGVKILPWLKADVAYDFLKEPSSYSHRALFNITATLKQGNLKASVRERYIHSWTPPKGTQSDVLRSQLKVQYGIPNSGFTPYVAVEVFTWGTQWKKTRHYVGCSYDFSKAVQLEAYYIYYTFNNRPAQHVLGIGLNFTI